MVKAETPDHLVCFVQQGRKCQCGCRQNAVHFMRCRKKRCVIQHCGTGEGVVAARDAHEKTCR